MKGKLEHWLKPENLIKIKAWMLEGCTLTDLSKRMNITRTTLRSWREKNDELDKVIVEGMTSSDVKVENSLFQRCLGMTVTDKYYEERYNKETKEMVKVLVKEVVREIAPDVKACMYWLKNRMPDRWQDKREVVIDTENDNTGVFVMPAIKELPPPPQEEADE